MARVNRVASENLVAAACAASAGVHAALVPEHLRESPLLGLGFVLAAVALFASATAFSGTSPSPRLATPATALLLAGLIAAYVVSRTVGLPGSGIEEVEPTGLATQAAVAAGLVAALHLTRKDTLT